MDIDARYKEYENIIHDIKMPICIISTTLETISSRSDRPEWFDFYADILNRNTYRIYKLVNDASDVGKISNGNFAVHAAYHDMVRLTEEAIISARTISDRKNIRLDFISDEKEAFTAIDKEIYIRIILNLLSNAIKFTGVNGCIDVRMETTEGFFMVYIIDDGIGISQETNGNLFTRYHMGKANNRSGSGLGLNIVRDLVEVLNGEISFMGSANGAGTTVTVKIPRQETENVYKEIDYLYDFYYENMSQIELSDAE